MKIIVRNRIEGLLVAAAMSAFLFTSQRASAQCTGYSYDATDPQCGPDYCCQYGTCAYYPNGGEGVYLCGAPPGTFLSGVYDGIPACTTGYATDAGPDAGLLCVGLSDGYPCLYSRECTSGICSVDAGVSAGSDGAFIGTCQPEGYLGPCTIGLDGMNQPSLAVGCDSGNCILHTVNEGVCGVAPHDATVGEPCNDAAADCVTGLVCDLALGPYQYTCQSSCQANTSECRDAGLGDCCGTGACVNSVCVPCTAPGGGCSDQSTCCPGDYLESVVMEPACSQSVCASNGPGGFCHFASDCQDTHWQCDGDICQPLGPNIGPCTQNEDCSTLMCCTGSPCTSGKCCSQTNNPCFGNPDCCSNDCNNGMCQ